MLELIIFHTIVFSPFIYLYIWWWRNVLPLQKWNDKVMKELLEDQRSILNVLQKHQTEESKQILKEYSNG